MRPRLSIVLSTYNQPTWLEKSLLGYAAQNTHAFEVIVADDGSTGDTRALLDRMRGRLPFSLRHLWQEDNGFRKCTILNSAIEAAKTPYLLFSDGDCIPRRDFVAQHFMRRTSGRFLSGGYFKLPRRLSHAMCADDIRSGRFAQPAWLIAHGIKSNAKLLKLRASGCVASVLNALTPAGATWNGHNASGWKADLERVNGFDERMQYGGEDRELGERLHRIGIVGKQIRYCAVVVHLDHDRTYVEPAMLERNRSIRTMGRRLRLQRCVDGIVKVNPLDGL